MQWENRSSVVRCKSGKQDKLTTYSAGHTRGTGRGENVNRDIFISYV